jgi:uncharacterized protein (TIGR03000 family)
MYSIVMMAAMTAAPEAPDFNGFFKNLFHHRHHATSCGGCWGGCSGCHGTYSSSCSGCGGCYGGCYGGGCYGGCGGCYGSHYAPIYTSCSGCTGCTGYSSCSGCTGSYYTACSGYSLGYYSAPHGYTAVGHNAAYFAPPVSYTTTAEQPVAGRNLPETRAQLLVRVPADAKLFADGQPTTLTGSERSFMTPEIAAGRDFAYTLKVEYTVDGQTKSESKKVVVRGGHMTAVDFSAPQTDRVSTEVTVTLPENSKLFVDGVAAGSKAGTHTFRTPELPKGQPFAYSFKAEVETNGRTESLVQRVVFKAGEAVKVDFTEQNATRTVSK